MISIVVPALNEEEVIPHFIDRVSSFMDSFGNDYEVIVVDDGSTDTTAELIRAQSALDSRWRLLRLSRNFGHQAALVAGIEGSTGFCVAILDIDLQDPPELIEKFHDALRKGADVAYAVRKNRKENFVKVFAYKFFYIILSAISDTNIPLDAGDFCMISRRVADILINTPEKNKFVRGIRAWVGFKQVPIYYNRPVREAGDSKYDIRKLVSLALNGAMSMSIKPLRIATLIGAFLCVVSLFGVVALLIGWWINFEFLGIPVREVTGWSSTMLVLILGFGFQFLFLGIVGEYIGRIFEETKKRPTFIVAERVGFSEISNAKEIALFQNRKRSRGNS